MIKKEDNNLFPLGSALFSDSESFLRDLSEQEESIVSGGRSRSRSNKKNRKNKKKKKRKNVRRRSRSISRSRT